MHPFWVVAAIIAVALAFDFINGFHDAANSIATIVSTRVLTPRLAVAWAAFFNFIAFIVFTVHHVAQTIAKGTVEPAAVTPALVLAALIAAVSWNLLTWWLGLPSSSSHALIGGLCGAALAASGNNWKVIIWSQPSHQHWWLGKGLLWKVIVPMLTSPLAGLLLGFLFMALLYVLLQNARPRGVNRFFGVAQLTLGIACQQHRFRPGFVRKFLLLLFVIGEQLSITTALILQTKKSDLGDWLEFPCLRSRAGFLQQRCRFVDHCLIDFSLFCLGQIHRDQPAADLGLRF
jgi:phosphate/sulfate permease